MLTIKKRKDFLGFMVFGRESHDKEDDWFFVSKRNKYISTWNDIYIAWTNPNVTERFDAMKLGRFDVYAPAVCTISNPHVPITEGIALLIFETQSPNQFNPLIIQLKIKLDSSKDDLYVITAVCNDITNKLTETSEEMHDLIKSIEEQV